MFKVPFAIGARTGASLKGPHKPSWKNAQGVLPMVLDHNEEVPVDMEV